MFKAEYDIYYYMFSTVLFTCIVNDAIQVIVKYRHMASYVPAVVNIWKLHDQISTQVIYFEDKQFSKVYLENDHKLGSCGNTPSQRVCARVRACGREYVDPLISGHIMVVTV